VELKAKQKILLALYDYQKNRPNVSDNIKSKKLGLDFELFCIAIEQLLYEGLIRNASVIRLGKCHRPVEVFTDSVKLTREGIDYAEKLLKDIRKS